MQDLSVKLGGYLEQLHIPHSITVTDVLEVLLIAFVVYGLLVWVKETRAWALLKGVIVIFAFLGIAALLNMTTILWLAYRMLSLAVIAFVVVLQPELRRALENLGRKNFVASIFQLDRMRQTGMDGLSDKTINEITRACVEMGKVKTGALIVIEHHDPLTEFQGTGIDVDAIVTSQLLINIFEHNTPLHDGAVIIGNNRVRSATCYLPLTESRDLSKELGTRHRAGVGISEVTDSMTVIVSEETGKISVAFGGRLYRGLSADQLAEHLTKIQDKVVEEKRRVIWKGKVHNEK